MTLYLDTEFNGYRGELISMALVPDEGPEWYAVRDLTGMQINPWVREHVLPHLDRPPLSDAAFKESFAAYIKGFTGSVVIVADWPEDIAHFCALMCGPNGGQILVWPTFRLVDSPPLHPVVPHNALSDARALRDAYERKAA